MSRRLLPQQVVNLSNELPLPASACIQVTGGQEISMSARRARPVDDRRNVIDMGACRRSGIARCRLIGFAGMG